MDTAVIDAAYRSTRNATFALTVLAVAFGVSFQLTKLDAIQAVSPFADDPWDAVGSIAIQAAAALAVLSLARIARLAERGPAAWTRDSLRFVLRGAWLAVAAVWATIGADGVAALSDPGRLADAGATAPVVALIALGALVVVLALVATAVLAAATRRHVTAFAGLPARTSFRAGMLGDAFLDVVHLASLPVRRAASRDRRIANVFEVITERFRTSPVARPGRRLWRAAVGHPWATVAMAAVGTATIVVGAEFSREGPPPSPAIGLLILGIFMAFELTIALGGFFVFGAYLGLRPPLRSAAGATR